jgi:hypothetical protein
MDWTGQPQSALAALRRRLEVPGRSIKQCGGIEGRSSSYWQASC